MTKTIEVMPEFNAGIAYLMRIDDDITKITSCIAMGEHEAAFSVLMCLRTEICGRLDALGKDELVQELIQKENICLGSRKSQNFKFTLIKFLDKLQATQHKMGLVMPNKDDIGKTLN